jgi:hypothetical protein
MAVGCYSHESHNDGQKNGVISKVKKTFISHLTRAQYTPLTAATGNVSRALLVHRNVPHAKEMGLSAAYMMQNAIGIRTQDARYRLSRTLLLPVTKGRRFVFARLNQSDVFIPSAGTNMIHHTTV